jgi:hypothetical protein
MIEYQYRLLRYHPNPISDEHVNIGIVLVPPSGPYGVSFARDVKRVQCLHADADPELIYNTIEELQRELTDPAQAKEVLDRLDKDLATGLQISDSHGIEAASAEDALAELKRMFLEPALAKPQVVRHLGARAMLLENGIRRPFTEAGVWDLMQKNVPVSRYQPGDPLKLDCGYGFDSTRKFFHAVSVSADPDLAKVVAFSYHGLVEGVRRIEKAETKLTAVVEDNLDRKSEPIAFALGAFEDNRISIAVVSEMPKLAELARKELRV